MELTQHPLSAAFPSMGEAEFQQLKDDIEVNGQRTPVWVFQGMVLDGWHRYRACIELGLIPLTREFDQDEDPVAFVLSENLHRRHLTESQRAAAVVSCSAWAPPHRLKNKQANVPASSKTNAQMAKEAGTSERTVKNAKVAQRAGLIEEVKEGVLSASGAAKMALGTQKKAKAAPHQEEAPAAPETPAADDGPTDAEIAAAEREAAEEIEALRKIALADDKVAAALDEAKRLRALNRVLQERLNEQMNKANDLVRRVKSLQSKLDKLERAAV